MTLGAPVSFGEETRSRKEIVLSYDCYDESHNNLPNLLSFFIDSPLFCRVLPMSYRRFRCHVFTIIVFVLGAIIVVRMVVGTPDLQ